VASVIGREFDFRLLAAVGADIAESQLLDALDEALESHVIVGAHRDAPYAGTERYQFSHSLIRQTLYDQLSASRRVRLHARVGEAIEGLYGDDVAGHASDLTYHFAEAAPVVGSEKLVRYSIMAGEQALATYAYDEALAHFERGLAAKIGRATDDETAEMLFGLGRAQAATMGLPQLQDAIATLSRAFEYYAESGNARKAVAIAEYTVTLFPGTTSMTQLIARALALAPPDSHEAGRLLTRYVRALGSEEGDYAGAKSAYSRALTIARREKDTALELRALVEMATVDFYQVRFRESMEKSQQAVELAQSLDDPRTEVLARHLAGQSPLHIAEPERARAHIAACLAAADRMRDRVGLTFALVSGMTLNSLEGDWKAARDLSDRSLALAPQDELFLWFRLLLEHQIGEFDQGKAYFERSLEMFQSAAPQPSIYYACTTLGIPLVARATGVAEHLDAAQKAARAILASPRVIPSVAWIARLALGLIAVYYGDAAEAEKQYITLEPHRGTILAMPSTDRVLGLLAGTMGKLDNAMAHFEDALAFCRKAGYRPELAWTCYDYADLLIGTRDVVPLRAAADKALALLDEALAITTELGMRPLKEKVITIQKQIESQPPRDDLGIAHAYPDGLTQREVEVLRLIAAGKSNREIAGELFIAVNTVQRHVQNILNKTRTTNRTEAAVYASRQGLVS
jgi:DNA-binding CsgD family transcriptional regulator/tetratricopeptide (TPR) repeat protein